MIKAALIGNPVSHSLSPLIHRYFLQQLNICGDYTAIETTDLQATIAHLISNKYAGFNVTIPHKEAVFDLCKHHSKTALATKAVNTVCILQNGELYGHNSDAIGFYQNLQQANIDLNNKNALVIGAGGACRAVVFSLLQNGINKIFIINRSQSRLQQLIADFGSPQIIAMSWHQYLEIIADIDFVINTTSLGMINQPQLNLDISGLNKDAVVCDIVYKPLYTQLLQQAQQQKNIAITGIGMLVYQAMVGFEMWFKKQPMYSQDLQQILLNKL